MILLDADIHIVSDMPDFVVDATFTRERPKPILAQPVRVVPGLFLSQ
jgi:hypothetical protein